MILIRRLTPSKHSWTFIDNFVSRPNPILCLKTPYLFMFKLKKWKTDPVSNFRCGSIPASNKIIGAGRRSILPHNLVQIVDNFVRNPADTDRRTDRHTDRETQGITVPPRNFVTLFYLYIHTFICIRHQAHSKLNVHGYTMKNKNKNKKWDKKTNTHILKCENNCRKICHIEKIILLLQDGVVCDMVLTSGQYVSARQVGSNMAVLLTRHSRP